MAYTLHDPTKPDPATQTGTQFGTSTRDNLNALRDAAIMGGGFPGFDMAATGGTPSEPATITYSKGVERVRASLTWSGGNVTVAVYAYSANSGADYTTTPGGAIGTKTVTYDGSGNVTNSTWS